MKLYILIAYLITITMPALAQKAEPGKIVSLKKVLTSLKGTAKVDGLNSLCEEYFNIGFFGENDNRTDSIELYAAKAYAEGLKLNYRAGLANAQLYLAFTETIRRKFINAEDRLQKILKTTNLDDNIYGKANSLLANIYGDKYNKTEEAIGYLKKSLLHFRRINNQIDEGLTLTRLCLLYTRKGDYDGGVEFCTRGVTLAKKLADAKKTTGWLDYYVLQSLSNIINFYKVAGDYQTAIEYLRQVKGYAGILKLKIDTDVEMGTLYRLSGKLDSSVQYLQPYTVKNPAVMWAKFQLAQTYLDAKDFDKAESLLLQCIDTFSKRNKGKTTMVYSVYAGKLYLEKKNYDKALFYARQTFNSAQRNNDYLFLLDLYDLLSKAYYHAGYGDSAYYYLQKNTALKDSGLTKQLLIKLNNYKREAEDERKASQIALLSKDNVIKQQQLQQQTLLKLQREAEIGLLDKDNKIKDQQLKQEVFSKEQKEVRIAMLNKDNKLLEKDSLLKAHLLSQESFQKKVLIAGLFVFLLAGFFIFRNLVLRRRNERLEKLRLENELKVQQLQSQKKQAELHQQTTELEMQALRAQMNPHFIFNCLSSINWFIIENNTEAASDYLTRFSRLIRMVLVNSQQSLISLYDELNMLQLYLDMERLRFDNSFDYNISTSDDFSAESVYVPPLILQPFCENAIRHGLMEKEGKKVLEIQINSSGGFLDCIITDNGIGRKRAEEIKTSSVKNETSLGLKITNDRLALLNGDNRDKDFFRIEDVVNENRDVIGTRVILKIRYRESVEVISQHNISQSI